MILLIARSSIMTESVIHKVSAQTDTESPPLISFCLIAYNQERFIREAVEGAFAQTYSPLEIILSDDCSTDRTFEIMREMASSYSGPHKIILNQNKKNLGIGGHVNRVVELSSGVWIVGAAGDDISFPERTDEIYKAWLASEKKAYSIDSEYEFINEYGEPLVHPPIRELPKEQQLIHFSITLVNYVHGCTHAWHRKTFDVFGPLPDITCEDVAIPPRSMLLGSVVCINKHLVKYRTHSNNIWESTRRTNLEETITRNVYYLTDRIKVASEVVRCIELYKRSNDELPNTGYFDKCTLNILANRERLKLQIKMLAGYPIIRWYALFKYVYLYGFCKADTFFFACAVSKTAYKTLQYCRNCQLTRHRLKYAH
jgi:glycosyltransferase involved in cell wall biosynthesis